MKSRQAGFALLFVFALAATVAIAFYLELPRIAFERQREKEQLLIERGEQYRRAIQLFVRKFNRYPTDLKELENTNNIRFLRRRYKDPMTGKPDWRLIHIGPGGVLLDSALSKPPGAEGGKRESAQAAQAGAFLAAEGGGGPQAVVRRRPSELPENLPAPGAVSEGMPGAAGSADPTATQMIVSGEPAVPGQRPYPYPAPAGVIAPGMVPPTAIAPLQPGQLAPGWSVQPGAGAAANQPLVPGQTGQAPGFAPGVVIQVPGVPGQLPSAPLVPITPQMPGAGSQQQSPSYPTQNVPGLPMPYGQPGVPSMGAITITPGAPTTQVVEPGAGPPSPPPYSTQPGVAGAPAPGYLPFPQPGLTPSPSEPAQNPAVQLIRELLTKPRPGGLAGVQAQQAVAPSGTLMGGGIAGVASTAEAESIMVYNDRTKYNEWEFVYDFRKDPLKMGQLGLPAAASQPSKTVVRQPDSSEAVQPAGSRRR